MQDLDALAEVYHDHRTALKLQLCGPLTFSRYVEDAAGEPALRDPGFVRDVCDALGEAALAHIAQVRRLAPEAQVVMQIDEPALQDVLRGAVSTASGYSRLRAVAEGDAASLLEAVVNRVGAGTERTGAAAHEVWLHDCGNRPSMRVAAHARFDALSFDVTSLTAADVEECGVLLDSGRRLVLGVLTPTDWAVPETVLRDRAIARSEWLRNRLSLDERSWASQVTLAPTCGLAGATAHEARAVLRAVSAAGRSVAGDTIALDDPGR
ncbi:MAG: hypothetical protein EB027_08100 [Actinobacteria bacterium]|nr:hypothetical protein [Actinomycetota bacterium]